MMGSLDPLGMPLATEVLSGERAADGFSLPIIERMRSGRNKTGRLFVGAGTLRALETRASLARHQAWYLSPCPLTGATAEAREAWITAGVTHGETGALGQGWRTNDRGHEGRAAEGDACERTCWRPDGEEEWRERGVVVRSPRHAKPQAAGLARRLRQAETPLAALTPPRGRGKRHMTAEATLMEAIDRVRTEHRVDGLLRVAWDKQVEQTTQYSGRGRGAVHREKRVIQTMRSHLTPIARHEDMLPACRQRFGWKALVTNAGGTRWSWPEVVVCSRNAYRIERLFHRRKSRVHIAPLFVKLNEHIEGLTYLLTLGGRV